MKLFVVGTGYVGLVSGACFSTLGIEVTCMDTDQSKIDLLNSGKIHIHEPGLEELVVKHSKIGNLSFVNSFESMDIHDAIVIAVGTPSSADGSADMSYVFKAVEMIAKHAKTDKFIIIKSTVPIGTAKQIDAKLKELNNRVIFRVISNPEFLREGCAVKDFLEPDRIVVGYGDEIALKFAQKLYTPFAHKEAKVIYTSNINAEIIKYASNSFLATKVAFINEIADLAEKVGGNIEEIAYGVGLDKRIGSSFLKAGLGYGGSCFPKDTDELVATANKNEVELSIVKTAGAANNRRKKSLAGRVVNIIGSLQNKSIAILGLTFKADTDDMRDSPTLDLIPVLKSQGAQIKAYDPSHSAQARKIFENEIAICDSAMSALKNADIIIIMTEWSEFEIADLSQWKAVMQGDIIFDFRNILKPDEARLAGFTYYSIGR